MKKIIVIFFLLNSCFILSAQYQIDKQFARSGYFMNPIFSGDYPDPSILVDGDDYYIVHSSFLYYPGLLVWHSKNLINWAPVGNALHKYVGSVWAPDFVKYKDKYYIYFAANGTNYVVWSNSIKGKWSDPINLKVGDIDPGHIVDENNKRFLFLSNGGYFPLSDDGLSINGELRSSFTPWPIPKEWPVEGICLEGIKIIKRGRFYYLTAAQGGTAGPVTGHMVISARSMSLSGPWEYSPFNPILRTTNAAEKWWSIGHATVFDDIKGQWWMVLHGYENGHRNLGRQTLLMPVVWTKDGWFKVPSKLKAENPIKIPDIKTSKNNYSLNDDFRNNSLKLQWRFFAEYDTSRFRSTHDGLILKGKGDAIKNTSPLLCNPPHHSYMAELEVFITGNATAGLILFYNNRASAGILANKKDLIVNTGAYQFPTLKNCIKDDHVFLRLRNINNTVDIFYSNDGNTWNKIEQSLEMSGYHHNVLGNFLSLKIGLCAIGDGDVRFKNFKLNLIP